MEGADKDWMMIRMVVLEKGRKTIVVVVYMCMLY